MLLKTTVSSSGSEDDGLTVSVEFVDAVFLGLVSIIFVIPFCGEFVLE